jgi:outer membrane biosynthesis protein TonB
MEEIVRHSSEREARIALLGKELSESPADEASAKIAAPAGFFLWQARGSKVRLGLDFVEKLARHLEDQHLNPAEEHGGVLFGRIVDDNTAEVTGFDFIRSEHHLGVAYHPGRHERSRVAQYVKRFRTRAGPKPIGYFRTHLRPGLFLDQNDFALMVESFSDNAAIALAIRPDRPGPSNAGIFFWEDGDIDRKQTQMMFPFDAATLRIQGPIDHETQVPATVGKARSPQKGIDAAKLVDAWEIACSRARPGGKLRGFQGNQGLAGHLMKAAPTALLWGAVAVISATAMVVVFQHGRNQAPRKATVVSAHSGIPDRTQFASVQPAPLAPGQPDFQPETDAPPAIFQDDPDVQVLRPGPRRSRSGIAKSQPAPPPKPLLLPIEVQPDTTPESASVRPLPPVTAPTRLPAPVVERSVIVAVSLEAREPTGLRRIAGRIPLLRHLQPFRGETGSGFTPARPSAPIEPRVPADVALNLSQEISVDVVVSIDKQGNVKNTAVIKGAGTGLGMLAADSAGLAAWEPARSDNRNVATDVVVHYRFGPAQ